MSRRVVIDANRIFSELIAANNCAAESASTRPDAGASREIAAELRAASHRPARKAATRKSRRCHAAAAGKAATGKSTAETTSPSRSRAGRCGEGRIHAAGDIIETAQ